MKTFFLTCASVMASLIVHVTTARAGIVTVGADVTAAYNSCKANYDAHGTLGSLITSINATGKTVTIDGYPSCSDPSHYVSTTPSNKSASMDGSTGTDSEICIDLGAHATFPESYGSCAEDVCADLYHELTHALRSAQGTNFELTPCSPPDYSLNTAEVAATRAENSYRNAMGLCIRDLYDTGFGGPSPVPPPLYTGGGGSVNCVEAPSTLKPPSCGSCGCSTVGSG